MDSNSEAPNRVAQGEQRAIQLHIDERQMKTSYANGFRTNALADEVIVDVGMNMPLPRRATGSENQPQIAGELAFQVSDRIILNYYTAKRLAITLGQIVRQHEERFGELQLNPSDRTRKNNGKDQQ